MVNLTPPKTRDVQNARKRIIKAVEEYKLGLSDETGILNCFFGSCEDDPDLKNSSLFEDAINFINSGIEREKFIAFAKKLEALPIADETRDPYVLCLTAEERIDREIVLKLNDFCPELIEDSDYQADLELSTCAHLCFSSFADKVNGYINNLSDIQLKPGVKSPLYSAFAFIEQLAQMEHAYVNNVIAVSFLDHLTTKKKELWQKLLGPRTRFHLQEYEIYKRSLGFTT